ncbi:PepSY domain-containing protein [Spirosoma rhododendri]|uniref:FAD-binding oxidoreductase n=1 Tax=Spirosoma rhododendri TaxID=2728024 RepID=A0A7L5DS10_9BACT|nr:PepSY domain-containing protein [Spirosoma rhododendri]QJD80392.1 FAD-binding oxidoreductase [Spirosoma rhododendri]
MTISIWRYSHLALAVSSFLLLALASITGIILAVEPVLQKTQPYRAEGFTDVTLAQTLPVLKKKYSELTELSVDHNGFVRVQGSDADGENVDAYVDPRTGNVLGAFTKKSEFFDWVEALHRSLFLHEAGRFFIGLTAFLLLLITVSGTALIIQRQRGIKRFFTRIVRDNFAQYWHVTLGRLSLIPILIIALSGTYLSLDRFELLGKEEKISPKIDLDAIKDSPKRTIAEIPVFQQTRLADVQSIEFPFADDPEEFYVIKLRDRELTINQVTGEVLNETPYPTTVLLANLSLNLHTGRASAVWALILAIASGNILFFIWSGFAITLKRRANRIKNKYTASESRFVILVGSENGSTFRFARSVQEQLLAQGETVHMAELNGYMTYPKAEHLIVLTATYGLGDAPTNAARFAALLEKHPQRQPVRYSVVGFGSRAYPDFCQFAFAVNTMLSHQSWAQPLVDIHTVDDKSPAEFSLWAEAWSQQADRPMLLADELRHIPTELDTLTVTANTRTAQPDGTFLVRLRPPRRQRVRSGDLLAIYPANDYRERLYSIGVVANSGSDDVQLSVRLHPAGLGSTFLHELTPGQNIRARIVDNAHFHFPRKAPGVLMIANGTGIAPFLGMISQNKTNVPTHLYCGFRHSASFEIYREMLETDRVANKLTSLHVAYSREGDKQYVSDLLTRDADRIASLLQTNGVVMICGSLAMQKDVLTLLETICQTKLNQPLSHYQSHGQVLTDCY